ncbi:extracellular solute-binding protein [Paenibacillus sp. FSL H8-0034]|uniref:extracellular solute-binding protein n=1 Tax=Paenibacillus sp. FSL H8-0034 TaxID=2954671 RepID=UPI0030F893BA
MNKQGKVLLSSMALMLTVTACSDSSSKQTVKEVPSTSTPKPAAAGSKASDVPLTVKILKGSSNINLQAPLFDYIFEKTNVKIQLELVTTNFEQKAQTIIATNSLPDIMEVAYGKQMYVDGAKNGLFLPISDYMSDAPNLAKIMKENKEIAKNNIDGKIYSFPKLGAWKLQLAQGAMIRYDLLEELGLEAPKTFDDLYKVLKKFKEKYPNSIPYTGRENAFNLLKPIAFAMGSGNRIYYDPNIEGGKYVYGQAHPEFKPVLEFMSKLFKEKLLDPDYAVNTADAMKEKLASGRSLFYYDNNSFGVNFNEALKPINPKARFELLPLMKNDRGQTRGWMYKKDWMHNIVISSKTKNPHELVRFLDWFYGEEGTRATAYGVEGVNYKMENGKPVILDSVLQKYAQMKDPFRNMQTDLATGFEQLALNVDEHPMVETSAPELVKWKDMITTEKGYVYEVVAPPFTNDELSRLKTLQSKVDTLVDQEMDKFIIGVRPVSDFDKFSQQLIDSGALEIEKIYNEANQRYLKQ